MTLLVLPLERVIFKERARPQAAAQAAAAYLDAFCLFGGGGPGLVQPALARRLLDCGGFEDGVELTWSLIFYFLTALAPPLRPPLGPVEGEDDVKTAFRGVGLRFGELIGRAEFDPTLLLEAVTARGGGANGLRLAVGGDSIEAFILHDSVRRLYREAYVRSELCLTDEPVEGGDALETLGERAHLTAITAREADVATALLDRYGLGAGVARLISADAVGRPLMRELLATALADLDPGQTAYVLCPTPFLVRCLLGLEHPAAPIPVGYATDASARRPLLEAGAHAVVSKLARLGRVLDQT